MTYGKDHYAVLSEVQAWEKRFTYGPSFRDLAKSTGLSVGHVHRLIRDLEAEGAVRYTPGVARSIGAMR